MMFVLAPWRKYCCGAVSRCLINGGSEQGSRTVMRMLFQVGNEMVGMSGFALLGGWNAVLRIARVVHKAGD